MYYILVPIPIIWFEQMKILHSFPDRISEILKVRILNSNLTDVLPRAFQIILKFWNFETTDQAMLTNSQLIFILTVFTVWFEVSQPQS